MAQFMAYFSINLYHLYFILLVISIIFLFCDVIYLVEFILMSSHEAIVLDNL